jgi:Family of unknown function (DUF6011)
MSKWKWVCAPADVKVHTEGKPSWMDDRLFDVGIERDGTLINPHDYPKDIVRAAVTAADARRYERQSNAAKKAAATRAVRRELKVNKAADRIRTYSGIGARRTCFICGKGLSDAISINRGIGPECWQDVLTQITKSQQERTHV